MRELILLTFIFILSGCLPVEKRAPLPEADDSINNGQDFHSAPNSNSELPVSSYIRWYHQTTYNSTLTVDFNNTNTVYLRGNDLSNYIGTDNHFSSTFCINIDFNTGAIVSKNLRVRATPKQVTNQTTGRIEYYLKVDLHDSASNQLCNLGIETYNSLTNSYTYSAAPVLANLTEDVCPTCLNIIGSNSVKLYQIKNAETNLATTALHLVNPSQINYSSLVFRIDMNNNSNNSVGTCTNASCHVQGFDCCSNNQCVKEKAVKTSGVNADPNGFAQAELEKTTNTNWYLKYPQFYYSCLIQTPTEDEEEDEGNPEADAQAFLNSMIADYECINELDENSLSEPFHYDPYNSLETYNECNVTTSSNTMYYENVMKRMYKYCGCSVSNLTDMVNLCPAYTYKANKNNNNVITSITCVTPPTPVGSTPFQNYNINLSSKSAPHRFFNSDGVEYNPDATSGNPTNTTQEGVEFQYLDTDKLVPENGSFNMNSILGQMTVGLDQARPAKTISIEFDQVYYIATLSGSYTPCPQCGKDSWFSNFTAYPITNMGSGLEAVGHNTERDAWGTNVTYGNYEDTIFGRACWLPPTMIAFSHSNSTNAQTQRLNRLQTQAALFTNGYQRDWYGFNKGALIGSFDGVTWFAIGKGRIIRSTSNKLFLAINAPFADLASPTQHVVAVKEYDGLSTGAHHDFDPSLALNHPSQNSAGTCQNYHQCETDTDCITSLGWEYTCADVNQYKTSWPKTNAIGATEVANSSNTGIVSNFLATGELPQGSSFRCVYRGAGAPCRVDYRNISDSGKREALACAPNFYCANLSSTTAVFNKEVARFAAPLEDLLDSPNHYYGKDAKVLGRPYHYITGTKLTTLNSYTQIKSAIENNVLLMDSSASGKVGLCRPGKSLASYSGDFSATNTDPNVAQESRDSNLRTDYISQISGCNSTLYNEFRYSSCPMIGSDGNYVHLNSGFLSNAFSVGSSTLTKTQTIRKMASSQNACGLETIDSNFTGILRNGNSVSALSSSSPFKAIEGKTLDSSNANIEPTLTRDACFRKAGSVCHTDYDCSPNKMMSDQVDLYALSFFGNNPEKKYYEEYLVCGQAQDKPYITDENFGDYSMPQNRCCREIGKDITFYTANTYGDTDTTNLQPFAFGGMNPTYTSKYSRYSNLEFDTYNQAGGVLYATNTLGSSKVYGKPDASTPFSPFQWRTINDSGSKTCCGGGWIRKFADGTNDWTKNRLNLDVNNFRCLNYRTPLLDNDPLAAFFTYINVFDPSYLKELLDQDSGDFCQDSTKGDDAKTSCAQYPISDSSTAFSAVTPSSDEWTDFPLAQWKRAELNTINFEKSTLDWVFYNAKSADTVPLNYLDWSAHPTSHKRNNIRITIPSYMTLHPDNAASSWTTVRFIEKDNPSNNHNCTYMGANSGLAPTTEWHYDGSGATCNPGAGPNCCWYFDYNTTTKTRTISVVWDSTFGAASGKDWGALIQFPAPGTRQFQAAGSSPWYTSLTEPSTKPGNYLYYLYRLARLELIGIPQATFPPLYCNNHYNDIVPGIFKDTITTKAQFATGVGVTTDPNLSIEMGLPFQGSNHVGTQPTLQLDPIFSANDFKCCRKLGMETDEASQCCSGYAAEESSSSSSSEKKKICKLPSGVSLNVYFNKFVSSEGIGSDLPGGGLAESDFNSVTGEIKTNQTTLQKLTTLGKSYCESGKVRRGGIFGRFPGQPGTTDSGTVYSIVDSTSDIGESSSAGETVEVGYDVFRAGFRWNHHVYCDQSGGN